MLSTRWFETMNETLSAVSGLSWGAHAGVGVALLAGLVVWATGPTLVRWVLLVVFTVTGGLLGYLMGPGLGLENSEWEHAPLLAPLFGAVFGLAAGAVTYRSAMALGASVIGALIGAFGTAAYLSITVENTGVTPQSEPSALVTPWGDVADRARAMHDGLQTGRTALVLFEQLGPVEQQGESLRNGLEEVDRVKSQIDPEQAGERLSVAAHEARVFLETAWEALDREWAWLSTAQRAMVGGAAMIGLAVGAFAGLLTPKWASGAVTSWAGGAVVLFCGTWLSGAYELPWAQSLAELTATHWLIAWMSVGVLGVIVQRAGFFPGSPGRQRSNASQD